MAIQSFGDRQVEAFFVTGRLPKKVGWQKVNSVARRKLDMVHYAAKLEDLRSPPANRLELLKGEWTGFWSIRVNDQWRVVFRWTERGPSEVTIVDYH